MWVSEQEYPQSAFSEIALITALKRNCYVWKLTALRRLFLSQSKKKKMPWEIKGIILFYLNEMEGSREYLFKA